MTDPHTGATANTPTLDDIVDDADPRAAALERDADAILAQSDLAQSDLAQSENRAFAPSTSIRQAVREDIHDGRAWASNRADRAVETIRNQPMKAALYAAGVGVLIGLLLRR